MTLMRRYHTTFKFRFHVTTRPRKRIQRWNFRLVWPCIFWGHYRSKTTIGSCGNKVELFIDPLLSHETIFHRRRWHFQVTTRPWKLIQSWNFKNTQMRLVTSKKIISTVDFPHIPGVLPLGLLFVPGVPPPLGSFPYLEFSCWFDRPSNRLVDWYTVNSTPSQTIIACARVPNNQFASLALSFRLQKTSSQRRTCYFHGQDSDVVVLVKQQSL